MAFRQANKVLMSKHKPLLDKEKEAELAHRVKEAAIESKEVSRV